MIGLAAADKDVFSRAYATIFRFPGMLGTLAAFLASLTLPAMELYLVGAGIYRGVIASLCFAATYMLTVALYVVGVVEFLDFRRCVWLFTMFSVTTVFFDVLLYFLGYRTFFALFPLSYPAVSIVVAAFSHAPYAILAYMAGVYAIVWGVFYSYFVSETALYVCAFSLAYGIVLNSLYLARIDSKVRQATGYGINDLFLRLARWIYSRDGSGIEDLLSKMGVRHSAEVIVVRAGNSALTILPVHFGPVHGVSGAATVKKVVESCRRLGIDVAVVRSGGSHERNPCTTADVDALVRAVTDCLCSSEGEPCSWFRGPVTRVRGDVRGVGVEFCGTKIVFIEKVTGLTDDIPSHILERLESTSENLIVTDAQNRAIIGAAPEFTEEDARNAEEVVKELCNDLDRLPKRKLLLGVGVVSKDEVGDYSDVCSGGVRAVVFSDGKEAFSLVVIDANNLAVGLREEISSAIKRELGVESIIVTTDSHELSGKLHKVGYFPAGSITPKERLVNACVEAVRRGIEKLREGARVCRAGVEICVYGDAFTRFKELVKEGLNFRRFFVLEFVPYVAAVAYSLAFLA